MTLAGSSTLRFIIKHVHYIFCPYVKTDTGFPVRIIQKRRRGGYSGINRVKVIRVNIEGDN